MSDVRIDLLARCLCRTGQSCLAHEAADLIASLRTRAERAEAERDEANEKVAAMRDSLFAKVEAMERANTLHVEEVERLREEAERLRRENDELRAWDLRAKEHNATCHQCNKTPLGCGELVRARLDLSDAVATREAYEEMRAALVEYAEAKGLWSCDPMGAHARLGRAVARCVEIGDRLRDQAKREGAA